MELMNGRLSAWRAHSVLRTHISVSVLMPVFLHAQDNFTLKSFALRRLCAAGFTALTCHQGALRRALLHEHHVLEQRTVRSVSACSRPRFGQVRRQVAAREEGRAEGEGRLQARILLGRGHLGRKETMNLRPSLNGLSQTVLVAPQTFPPHIGSSSGRGSGGQPQGDVG